MTEADVPHGTLGSWPCALGTGGTITDDDEATLVRAMGSLAAEMNRPTPYGVMLPDVGALSAPDSKLAVETVQLWTEAASNWLRAMHLNIDVPRSAGDLNYLVAAGTLVDVAGVRLQLLPPRFVEEVLTLHPRGDFGNRVGYALEAVGRRYASTRCCFLTRTLGVGDFARACPLDEHPS